MRVTLPARGYSEPAKTLRFFADTESRVAAIPGVQSVGIGELPAVYGAGRRHELRHRRTAAAAAQRGVGHRRHRLRRTDTSRRCVMPLLKGRLFTEREMREKSNVVVINDALAQRYFPGQDPIGKQLVIYMTDAEASRPRSSASWQLSPSISAPAAADDVSGRTRSCPYTAMTLTYAQQPIRCRSRRRSRREVHALSTGPAGVRRAHDGSVGRRDPWRRRDSSSLLLSVFAAAGAAARVDQVSTASSSLRGDPAHVRRSGSGWIPRWATAEHLGRTRRSANRPAADQPGSAS